MMIMGTYYNPIKILLGGYSDLVNILPNLTSFHKLELSSWKRIIDAGASLASIKKLKTHTVVCVLTYSQ